MFNNIRRFHTKTKKGGGAKIDRAVLSVINPSFQSFDEQSNAMPETPLGFDHLAEYDYHENLLKLQSTPASECSEAVEANYYFESLGLPTASKRESVSQKSSRDSHDGSSLYGFGTRQKSSVSTVGRTVAIAKVFSTYHRSYAH